MRKKTYKLFNIIPILKTKTKNNITRILLFGFIPLFKIKNNDKIIDTEQNIGALNTIEQKVERLGIIAQNVIEQKIETCLMNEITEKGKQKQIFKEFVSYVEIGVHSKCNRECWFCPNSFIDRHSENILMEDKVFHSILKSLQEIEYNNTLSFHRYNEPLIDKDYIIKRVKEAREYLPHCYLFLNTNGDLLTKEILQELKNAGLNQMRIQCYLGKNEEFDIEKVLKPRMQLLIDKLELGEPIAISSAKPTYYAMKFKVSDKMEIIFEAQDFAKIGNNRAGTLSLTSYKSFRPCNHPLYNMYIDYNGTCTPCCDFRFDIPDNKDFVLGDVSKNTIFEVFTSAKYVNCRKQVCYYGAKNSGCDSCLRHCSNITEKYGKLQKKFDFWA
ncbi:MAG: hypothetical protein Ta2D_01930 [Rickettsiales bacterium]|nr:MAG: hypothetical protein Ta2D_01930 [Rickettsiales bacterium]